MHIYISMMINYIIYDIEYRCCSRMYSVLCKIIINRPQRKLNVDKVTVSSKSRIHSNDVSHQSVRPWDKSMFGALHTLHGSPKYQNRPGITKKKFLGLLARDTLGMLPVRPLSPVTRHWYKGILVPLYISLIHTFAYLFVMRLFVKHDYIQQVLIY